jgi:hypothetical protein
MLGPDCSRLALASCIAATLLACDADHHGRVPHDEQAPARAAAKPPAQHDSAAHAPPAQTAFAANSPRGVVEAAAKPALPLLAQPARSDLVPTKALLLEARERVGITLGQPPHWSLSDPSFLLLAPPASKANRGTRLVAMRLARPGLDQQNLKRLMKRGAELCRLRAADWASWAPHEVGHHRLSAMWRHGKASLGRTGGPALEALAVAVDVPGAPALGVLASWPSGDATLEALVIDMLRRVERCQVEVGHGCVSDDSV